MRRKDIEKASSLNKELAELERKLAAWRDLTLFEVSSLSGNYSIELGDYPPPSEIGRTYEAVKCAVVDHWARAVDQKKAELAAVGVNLDP
jgi:hypothetical protein